MTATAVTAADAEPQALIASDRPGPVIVIGSGPVGIRFVQELLARNPEAPIALFGNEPYAPYNRVQLSSVLAGEIRRDAIDYPLPDGDLHPKFEYINRAIRHIDVDSHTVTDALGQTHGYSTLVLATGSRAFVPNIPGIRQAGVYTFRNLKDTDALYARLSSAKHIVVVGGGLLGIEAARALCRFNTRITLVHQGDRLMNRQLDATAAGQLAQKLREAGIDIILNSGVRVVHGMNRAEAVTLRDGEKLNCDTVLFCTGISCNLELAREAGIKTGRGISINELLQTSAPDVYAIGECSEFNQQVFGFAGPGLDQAAVVADILNGGHSRYLGSSASSRLKVVDEQVFSTGDVADFTRHGLQREIIFQKGDSYRKLVVHRSRLIGILGIGDWPELPRIQELYQQQRKLLPWQLWLFRLKGRLWLNEAAGDARSWPATAVVCQCNNIDQGALMSAIGGGCNSLATLSERTRAGSVCGSCKPLLQQLLGDRAAPEKDKARTTVLGGSVIAILVALIVLLAPALAVPDSAQQPVPLAGIWNDGFWKQVTGFTLLGLSAVGLLMSLRKRINSHRLGDFAYWRAAHIVLGVLCVSLLILHTGFHLGVHLNRYLMVNFLLVTALGAGAGIAVAVGHRLSPAKSLSVRKNLAWIHLLVSWPLPLLLGMHILSVYYF